MPASIVFLGSDGKRYCFDEAFHIDKADNSLVIINHNEHLTQIGRAYHCGFENMCTNVGEMSVIAFNTPLNVEIHLTAAFSCTSISRVYLLENPTIDVGEGTQLMVHNLNRNITSPSTLSTIDAVPVSGALTSYNEAQAATANISIDSTTTMTTDVVGSVGIGVAGTGGRLGHEEEWILQTGQQYAAVIESLDASDNYHTIHLRWNELRAKGEWTERL